MQNKFIPESKEDLLLLGNLHIASRAIHFLAQYPIADFLLIKPRSIQEVASHFSFEEVALSKLFRVLSSFNILKEDGGNVFSLTEVGKHLCHAESLKDFLLWDETRWTPLGKLEKTIKTGLPVFSTIYGEEYFNYLSKHPNLQKRFDEHMRAVSFEENQILAEALPLKESSHFIDIGGGKGGLVEAILKKKSSARASLLDLPETIDAVAASLQEKYPGRVSCLKGSFFDPIQGSYDAIILKRVLHDWNDDQCLQILHRARKALRPNGQILIIETILEGNKDTPLARLFDLFLLNLFGGRERNLEDYKSLLTKAELKFSQQLETTSSMGIIAANQ